MQPPPFSVRALPADDGIAVVEVSGEVDLVSAPYLEQVLGDAIREPAARGVVIDLSGVTFIDSSGLNALVRTFERRTRADPAIAIVNSSARLAALLEVSRLDRLLAQSSSRAEAVASLAISDQPD